MSAYLIVDTLLNDPDTYEQYKVQAKPIAESFGGEYLARGGDLTVLEDDLWSPSRIVLIRFPSADVAREFHASGAYQAILPISQRSATRTAVIVEGV